MHRWWLVFFDRQSDSGNRALLRPRWSRITAALLLLGLLGWAGLATALFGYLRWQKGVTSLSWFDAAWPGRWETLSVRLGEHYLSQADSALAGREFDRALLFYRAGLSRAPLSTDARLQLAQLYVASRRPDLAQGLLLDRLDVLAGNEPYLRRVLHFLSEFQYDADLAATCDRLLANPASPHRALVAYHAAMVAFHRGNYDRAENLLLTERLDQTPEGALLLARLDAERDYTALAILRLEQLVHDGTATDAAYAEIARIQRQLGQTHKLATTATLHLASDPLSPAPRITLLHLHHERGDQAALAREIDSFFTFFSNHPAALLALGDFAASTGRPDLARRVEEISRARGWPMQAPALMSAEALIAAGQFAAGLDLVRTYLRENPAWAGQLGPVFDSLQAIVLFGLNRSDEARLHLDHLLSRPNLRTDNLHAVASRLLAIGQSPHARTVLARAVALDASNQSALTLLVRLEAEAGQFQALPAHVRQLLQTRKPSREVLALVHRRFGSDLNLLHPEQTAVLAEIAAHLGPPVPARL